MEILDKTLLKAMTDGHFHSGTELASILGVSRASVWKHVRTLESFGLELAAVPGRGYRLTTPVELLDEPAIRDALGSRAQKLLARLEIHDGIDSTNSHLMRLAAQGAPAGIACLAEYQHAGRGRVGRQWVSPFGANICLSLLWRFEDPSQVAGLSLAVGVAIVRALADVGVTGASLKWPNDLMWNGAKLGGILLEVSGEAHGQCAVVIGLGLNRHIPDRAAAGIDQAWTDLGRIAQEKGIAAPSRNHLAGAILDQLLPLVDDYPQHGLKAYLPEWREAHAFRGRAVMVQLGETVIEGRLVDISDEGLLILEQADGSRRQLASGDVRLRVKAE